jgi:hypothetical protein
MVCRYLTAGLASTSKTRLLATSGVSDAVAGRGGHASLSEVVAAPGVRRDAGDGDQVSGRGEPAGKVGQAALGSKSGDWGWVTMQHGSPPPGGQPEDSGGWTGGGGGRWVALRIKAQGGSPPTLLVNFPCILRPRPENLVSIENRKRQEALMD